MKLTAKAQREKEIRLKLRDKHSDLTYNEVMKLIRTNGIGKAMVVRPTGFGKSYMLARVTSESTIITNGGTALYVYPYDTIKSDVLTKYGPEGTSDIKFQNTEFMTYRMFTSMGKRNKGRDLIKYLNENNVRILLLDEVHLAGAEGFKEAYDNIQHKIGSGQGKTRMIGVTATPYRMDGFDILNEVFDGHQVYRYTMDDCIRDRLMAKPVYKSTIQESELIEDIITEFRRKCVGGRRASPKILEKYATMIVRGQEDIEINEMTNPGQAIRNTVQRTLKIKRPNYLKFIVFFPTIKSMGELENKVTNYYSSAFPYLKQRITRISSAKESDDVEDLHKLRETEEVIDLIFAVNKINMGYHVDDINGIMMMRGTRSDIIYKQQIGRCMSITSEITPIVFDMVNNKSRKPYYKITEEDIEDGESTGSGGGGSDINEQSLSLDRDLHEYTYVLDQLVDQLIDRITGEVNWLHLNRKAPLETLVPKYSTDGWRTVDALMRHK